jgi:protein-L-isoaspartate O-methyltransferase
MPSIVLSLLESLHVHPGQRMLDVGTGSGYLAALACERVGSDSVTSLDLGDQIVEFARQRLGEAGYAPSVVGGDGFAGHLPNAPYDRIVSTVSVHRVPRAWIEQTRPGGLIVATMPEMTVRLQRREDGSASGRFIAGYAFMWMRGHAPDRRRDEELVALVHSGGDTRDAPSHLRTMLSGGEIPAFWGLARLIHMPFDTVVSAGPGQTGIIELSDRSWVLIDVGRGHITQGGPRRLWDAVGALYERLDRAGRPPPRELRPDRAAGWPSRDLARRPPARPCLGRPGDGSMRGAGAWESHLTRRIRSRSIRSRVAAIRPSTGRLLVRDAKWEMRRRRDAERRSRQHQQCTTTPPR